MASPTARSSCNPPTTRRGRQERTNRGYAYSRLLFLEHRTDLGEVEVLFARLVALVHHADVSLAIDEHGARHYGYLVHLADLAVSVEHNREAHRLLLRKPGFSALGIRLDVHAHQGEAHGLVLLVDVFEQRHFLSARSAPGGPEVDHDDLALELGEVDDLAIASGELERRGGARGGSGEHWQREHHGQRETLGNSSHSFACRIHKAHSVRRRRSR